MNTQENQPNTAPGHHVGAGVVALRAGKNAPEVLLIRRGKAPKAGEWSIPGGRQEIGETVRETAARELVEETTLVAGTLGLLEVVDLVHKDASGAIESHWTLVDFYTCDVTGTAEAGTDAAEARWVPLEDLPSYRLWSETERVIRKAAALPWPPLET